MQEYQPPTGGDLGQARVRTFLIADVRGYSSFTIERGDERAAKLAARFADVVEEVVTSREGQVVELRGDEALVVFLSPRRALCASVDLQQQFAELSRRDPSLPLNVGIGLDAGEAIPVKGGYRGAALNLAARLCSHAESGEVLATDTVTNLARKVEGLRYVDRGMLDAKGFPEPVRVWQIAPREDSGRKPVGEVFQVRVLGSLEVIRNGSALETSEWRRWPQSLLKLLVTVPEHRRTRDELVDLLWPESLPRAGASNLRYAIHLLRRDLGGGDPSPVLSERGWISLNTAYGWEIDLERFTDLADHHDDEAALQEALQIYRGTPLAEDRYDDWAGLLRDRIQRAWRVASMELARKARENGKVEMAIGLYQRLLDDDPFDETTIQDLLRTLTTVGRRAEALKQYGAFERRLHDELDVLPSAETIALIQDLRGTHIEAVERIPTRVQDRPAPVPTIPSYPFATRRPLVGRRKERDAILAGLPVPGVSVPPKLILVSAEAGMGKTRLLAEVAQRARELDVQVLAGGCYEQEGRLPYGPIHDALVDHLLPQPDGVLTDYMAELPDVVRIMPELRSRVPMVLEQESTEIEAQRLRLFLGIAHLTERLAHHSPVVLFLDDLHWADDATLQLLHFLLRQPDQEGVLIIGAYREEALQSQPGLRNLVTEIQGSNRALSVGLAALNRAELSELFHERLGGACADHLVAALHERTAGNPFYALQILTLLEDVGHLERCADGWDVVGEMTVALPPGVRSIIAKRVGHLDGEGLKALRLGAVLGREFSYRVMEALWDKSEDELLEALDASISAKILDVTEEGYVFRHPVLREVVYDEITPHKRARLHAHAGAALEEIYAADTAQQATELAWHFLQGRDAKRALTYTMVAADHAEAVSAHAEAERHFRTAIRLSRETENPAGEAEALERLGILLRVTGRLDEALDVLESAIAICRAIGDPEGEARATRQAGIVHFVRGTPHEGIARARSVVDHLELLPDAVQPKRALTELYMAITRGLWSGGKYTEALAAINRAGVLAQSTSYDKVAPIILLQRGISMLGMGRLGEARRDFEDAIPLLEAAGNTWYLTLTRAQLGRVHLHLGALESARELLQCALASFETVRDPAETGWTLCYLGDISNICGDWGEAWKTYELSAGLARDAGSARFLSHALLHMGELCLLQGRKAESICLIEEGIVVAQQGAEVPAMRTGQRLLAELDLMEGRPEAAVTRLQPIADELGPETPHAFPPSTLADAYLECGDVARAQEVVVSRLDGFKLHAHHKALATWLRVHGRLCSHQGRTEEAGNSFAEAVSISRSIPYTYAEARALYEWGTSHVLSGDRAERAHARMRLTEALNIFQRLGAQPSVIQTTRALEQI